MDTLIERKQFIIPVRTCEYALTFLFFLIFVLSNAIWQPPTIASELVASNTIIAPTLKEMSLNLKEEINPAFRKEKFDERIQAKYKTLQVNDVADGIKHIKMTKYYGGRPVKINIVEVNQKVATNFEVKPAIASETLANRRTLKTIAKKTNSIVAINGGFFKPQTGVPLGTLMIDGKMLTGPIYNRVALGIFDNGYDVGRVKLDASIKANGEIIKIDNINQPRILSSYILLYTKDWGSFAPASPQYGVQLQVVGDKIVKASANPLSIPKDGYVIVGPKSKLEKLFGAKKVDLKISTNPEWENVRHIISGGPYLVKDDEIFIDMTAQKLQAIGGRNPRTAIGYTENKDLILVTVDGREGNSIGMTLRELANFMKDLGCTNAINLDGGGSTVMYVNGNIVNQPHQIGGIPLSNALVISEK